MSVVKYGDVVIKSGVVMFALNESKFVSKSDKWMRNVLYMDKENKRIRKVWYPQEDLDKAQKTTRDAALATMNSIMDFYLNEVDKI